MRKKPGERQKEKFAKYLSGEYRPKGRKTAILGGVWPSNGAPAIVYKAMITGEWFTKAQLLEKIEKRALAKWNDMYAKERDRGDLKFWSAEKRIESGIRRIKKAGELFGQWSVEEKRDPSGQQQYRLVIGSDVASKVRP
jgi:hypothetical protein